MKEPHVVFFYLGFIVGVFLTIVRKITFTFIAIEGECVSRISAECITEAEYRGLTHSDKCAPRRGIHDPPSSKYFSHDPPQRYHQASFIGLHWIKGSPDFYDQVPALLFISQTERCLIWLDHRSSIFIPDLFWTAGFFQRAHDVGADRQRGGVDRVQKGARMLAHEHSQTATPHAPPHVTELPCPLGPLDPYFARFLNGPPLTPLEGDTPSTCPCVAPALTHPLPTCPHTFSLKPPPLPPL